MGLLRLYLALSVLVAHTGPLLGTNLAGGPPAVQAFFTISGFYMALVLHEKYPTGRAGTLAFWLNRLLRLAPLYVLVLAVTAIVAWQTREHSPFFLTLGRLSPAWQALVWAVNVTGVGLDGLLFVAVDPASDGLRLSPRLDAYAPLSPTNLQLVGQGWTLSLEMYFYLLAPWLVRLRLRWLLIAMGLSLACRVALAVGPGWQTPPFYYQFFPSELATFLLGTLAYHGYRHVGCGPGVGGRWGWWSLPALIVLTPLWFRLPVPAKSLGYAAIVAAIVPALFVATRSSRWDRWVGELSYPVYLFHGLAMLLLGPRGQNPLIVLAVTLIASAAAVALLEWPVERLRQRLARRVARPEAATAPGEA